MHFIKFKVQISTFKVLKVLDRSIHLSSVLFLLQSLALVILLLTLAEGNVHLGSTVIIDKDEGWNNGETGLLAILLKTAQFTLGKEQLAVAASLMIGKRAIEIRRDIHTLYPKFSLIEIAIAIYQRCLTATDRLDLGTGKYDTSGISINEEVLERCLLVAYLYRTLLTEFLIFLVHNSNTLILYNSDEVFDMLINIESHLAGPLLFVLYEFIIEIIKLREFLIKRHEILIAHIPLDILVMTLIEEMTFLDKL